MDQGQQILLSIHSSITKEDSSAPGVSPWSLGCGSALFPG